MKVTLLGTGTSQGVPVIGCTCAACVSDDPRDDRLRTSMLVSDGPTNILVDTSPDLRMQMLRYRVSHIDAVIYTHEHNDHVIGLDDIRPFNFAQRKDMPLFGLPRVMNDIKSRFAYVFQESPYPGVPRGIIHHISGERNIEINGIEVVPIPVLHGKLPILGYRFGDISFITDASFIDERSMSLLKGSKYLVLNALQKEDHYSHFTLAEALEVVREIGPEKAYLTHTSHRMGPTAEWEKELPAGVFPAYDGLVLEC